jgi:hypothetical protein
VLFASILAFSSTCFYCFACIVWSYVPKLNPYGKPYNTLHVYILPVVNNVVVQIIVATIMFMLFVILSIQFEGYLTAHNFVDTHALRLIENQLSVLKNKEVSYNLETVSVNAASKDFSRNYNGGFGILMRTFQYTLVTGLSFSVFCCCAVCLR